MRVIRALVAVLIVLVIGVGVLFLAARFHDGPIAMIPGGPLRGGELATERVTDWRFAAGEDTIELQLDSEDRSRTTWILVLEGEAFIPCSLGFPPGKRWYKKADRDGAAIVRIAGRRYPVVLERVKDPALSERLEHEVVAKYGRTPPSDAGVWFFRLRSRSPSA